MRSCPLVQELLNFHLSRLCNNRKYVERILKTVLFILHPVNTAFKYYPLGCRFFRLQAEYGLLIVLKSY